MIEDSTLYFMPKSQDLGNYEIKLKLIDSGIP